MRSLVIYILSILALLNFASCNIEQSDEFEFSEGKRSPAGEVEPVAESKVFLDSRSINIRFANKDYIANHLREIFGTESSNLLESEIRRDREMFGGACLLYTEKSCPNRDSAPEGITSSSPLRSGRMIYVCEKLITEESSWGYFVRRNGLEIQVTQDLDKEIINSYYKKFYTIEDAPEQFVQMMMGLNDASELADPVDKHKLVLFTACISSKWQIL